MRARRDGRSLAGGAMFWALLLSVIAAGPGQAQDLTEKIALCTSCHGENGMPVEPDIPILAGQEFYYLYVQLKDYKSGLRANETMAGIVAELTKEEMQALAQHFSEQPWPSTGYRTPDSVVATAQSALTAGQCTQCHLGNYHGNSRVPRLAGQQVGYLERTMFEFKNRLRMNAPDLASLFESYGDVEIKALADYLAGL